MPRALPDRPDQPAAETTASDAPNAQHTPDHAFHSRDPARRVEYDRILVPVTASPASERAVTTAAMLASERKGIVTLLNVIEVPKELPLDALFPDEEHTSQATLSHATAILERYGVKAITRTVHATTAATAILDIAAEQQTQIIIMGTERRTHRQRTAIGSNVEHVLKRAPCRVMIVGTPPT